ncbi:transporter substrate-binding domain-containing protein, partial [Actinotignum sp. GS-2025c]|uniref:transporter substrate-binding domain-containing protein n=1 Tax=Actinotignum sp. GS-2025c TaxID=3427276 RepID=UPI003F459C13
TGCSSPDLSGSGDSAGTAAGSGTGAGSATVGARTPEQIKEAGSIRIGTFADKAPFGSLVGKNTYEGYDIVYGDRLGKDLGVKVEWVPVDASSRVEFLKSGKVDVILANFTVTPERAAQVDFANPYMKVSFGAVSSAKDPVRSEAELANKNIIIVKGTSQDAWITANHPEWKVTKYEQYTEATNALTDGRGDVWITDNTEALAFTEQNKDFVTGIASFGEESTIAAAVQQGNTELRDWINNNLVDLGKENFFHKDLEQTLAPVYGTAISPDELVIEGGAR